LDNNDDDDDDEDISLSLDSEDEQDSLESFRHVYVYDLSQQNNN
jgi:hypothetical protein